MFFNCVVIVVYIVVVLCYIDIDQFEDKLMIELLGELGEGQLLLFCTSCPKITLQDHILAAMITTEKSLPCLQEMVENYLSEARVR